jgi:glycosyltransferase involved in cell wall biosynthesis
MQVLFVTDHLGYAGGTWHGCTTYFVNVLPQLRRMGHHVALCVLREEHPAADVLRGAGVEVTSLNARRAAPSTFRHLQRLVASGSVDVLHANQRESSALARILGWYYRSTVTVTHVVDSWPLPRFETWVTRCLPQPDVTLCVSAYLRETAIREYGIHGSRVQVLHNAIDVTAVKPSGPRIREQLRNSWGIAVDAPVVVSTSRFTEEKRLDLLVDMIPSVLAEAPTTVFVFAGAGPDLDGCKEKAARLGVAHATRFLGYRTDIPDVLAAGDIAVMLCLKEAFGYSAVEALAMGVPVVAYAAAGLVEVITHEQTGLLAAAGDDATFRASLVRLLLDSKLRHTLGEKGRKDVRRFDVEHHGGALTRLYTELLQARRGRETSALT